MSMKKKHTGRIKLAGLLVLLLTLLILPQNIEASEKLDPEQNVTMTLVCRDDSKPVQDMPFRLYRVADVTENVEFTLTDDFKDSGLSVEQMDTDTWQNVADTLADYIDKNPSIQPFDSGKTDASGELHFPTGQTVMKAGLYLVMGDQLQSGETVYTPAHSLVCLPDLNTAGEWIEDRVVYPKLDKTGTVVDRKVMKIWKDDGYTSKRPDKIEVNLLHDGKLYETVTLSAENQWQYTWQNLSALGEWTAEEKNIPSGYTASVQADGTGFIITNTYTPPATPPNTPPHLPQTGVLWWPVPILAVAGLALFMLGWLRRQKNGDANDNN